VLARNYRVVGLSFKSGRMTSRVPQCSLSSDCSAKVARSNLDRCLTGAFGSFKPPLHREEIPHIGVLLSTDLEEVVRRAEFSSSEQRP